MPVQTASGRNAAVVSSHSIATAEAIAVLRNGGNVIDAAIAGAALLTVALPHACGPGGDCFILCHIDGRTYCLNGSGASPARLPRGLRKEQMAEGPLSCATPGMLGAWEALHKKFGKLPWAGLMSPAIERAKGGIPVCSDLTTALAMKGRALAEDPGCIALYAERIVERGGSQVLVQTRLAETLEVIAADGAAALYRGAIGRSLCAAVQSRGGVLAQEDLRAYEPLWVEPLEVDYRDFKVQVAPPNSYGILMLMQIAALGGIEFNRFDLASEERLRALMASTRAAMRRCDPLLADPNVVPMAPHEMLSADAVAELRAAITADAQPPTPLPKGQGTAVISVADHHGNGVVIVQSIFTPFGSVVADAETGIVLNNRLLGFSTVPGHPNEAAPSKRPGHTLCPAIVLEGGKVRLLLGTPGGTGQTLTLTQIMTNVIDHRLGITGAIAQPRWSMDLGGDFVVEAGIDDAVVAALNRSGFKIKVATPQQSFFFGSAECIEFRDGTLIAAADYRRNAGAAAY